MPSLTLRRLEGRLSGRAPGLVLAASVIAGGFGLGLAYAHDAASRFDVLGRLGGLEVRQITVTGQKETSDSALVASMGLEPGGSILGVDVGATRERLEALPWVTSATVRKTLPGSLDVTVAEAEAFARWAHEGRVHLVSREGEVLADEVRPGYERLPLIAGRGANLRAADAVELIARHPEVAPITAGLLLVSERRWDLRLTSGATIRLPQEGADAALVRLARLNAAGAIDLAGRAVVDLRLEGRTTVELAPTRDEAPETLPAGEADPLADMIAEGQRYDDPLARAIAEAAL